MKDEGEVYKHIKQYINPNNNYTKDNTNINNDVTASLFLTQTVIEDAHLLLLSGSSTSIETAKSLARFIYISILHSYHYHYHYHYYYNYISLGLLTGMNNGDLLNKYLESARILIESTVSNMDTLGLETAYGASKLTQAVLTLQRTLLDVYHIFFDITNNTQGSL